MVSKSDKWHATRNEREEKWFRNTKWEIVREVTAEAGDKFVSPLGYKLKSGFEVRLVQGNNFVNSAKVYVGKATLKRMHDVYDAVELPAPKKRGRPKKVTVAEPPTEDARSGSQAGPTFDNPNAEE